MVGSVSRSRELGHVEACPSEVAGSVFVRVTDLVLLTIVLPLAVPLAVLTAITLLFKLGRPLLIRQSRVGLGRREFELLKFRTLPLEALQTADRDWSIEPADRVLGTIRALGLDELPQLVNVLRGEMALVGPRPERLFFAKRFAQELPRYGERHAVRPGITGLAQVKGLRGDTSIAERLAADLRYIRERSFWLDLKILLHTGIGFVATLMGLNR